MRNSKNTYVFAMHFMFAKPCDGILLEINIDFARHNTYENIFFNIIIHLSNNLLINTCFNEARHNF